MAFLKTNESASDLVLSCFPFLTLGINAYKTKTLTTGIFVCLFMNVEKLTTRSTG